MQFILLLFLFLLLLLMLLFLNNLNGWESKDFVGVFESANFRYSVQQESIVFDESPPAKSFVHEVDLAEVFRGVGENPFEMLEIERIDLLSVSRVVVAPIFARFHRQ